MKRILQELQTYLAKTRDFSISAFVKTLPSELVSVCDQAYLWDVSDSTDTEAKYQEEWKKTVRELKRAIIRKKIADLNQELHAVDDPTLQERLSELTKELSLVEKSALS